jgi:hypothetical protein
MPAIMKVGEATIRDNARLSCCVVALAAERFRLKHQRWSKALDELVPAFLAELPPDPYLGAPLRYADRDDGVVIYSVGRNRQDDGGEDLRNGWNAYSTADLGLRLWSPEKRGLPPLPAEKAPGAP